MADLNIFDITPFTMTDYANKLSAVLWFSGCNMRCVYCYNVPVVLGKAKITFDELMKFLNERQNRLEAVVFSGGECTLSAHFLELLSEVKRRNFKVKVDTNGTNFSVLKTAINQNLIDFISLDFKATKEKFHAVTGSNLYENFAKTLRFLIDLNFDFEVRTTIHADILNEDDVSKMAKFLEQNGYKNSYFLQNFLPTKQNFGSLNEPKNSFDTTKIKTNLDIKLRNF
ncbi:anaerobic ribonucleoside-triphosphate reductase activating protein [Campylobacter gastrosuis]|uniref:Anaerobic ribonucleoside-triphosphate reductase activating protein n=1 Tax=Campylobacter gastrosuis TaxID=2974576 RepID=A0ABT7HS87_9BACT|nr:anaerobic ribonucleoside-triphosphate reductase activating protein [Campylobacter gastrosuis]MDL0089781.1 anaerobic ribonucleoside-triphosphate reductase activating protein [Campylobacter gastrosuis]